MDDGKKSIERLILEAMFFRDLGNHRAAAMRIMMVNEMPANGDCRSF